MEQKDSMLIKKGQWPILIINTLAIIGFTLFFVFRQNYEFVVYIGVIIFFLLVVLLTNSRVNYPNTVLWGLTVWALLHMCGGSLYIGEKRLYEFMLLNLVGEPYPIFKYDQFVHIIGFGVATLAMYYLLKPLLKPDNNKWIALSIIVVMAGLGVGALNEIIEFFATVIVPKTGVGGYINSSLDLVSDLIGAIGAMTYLYIRER